MRNAKLLAVMCLLVLAACAPRRDPMLEAAEDFRDSAYKMVEEDENRAQKLNSLRLGMTDEEVLATAGPPSSRGSEKTTDSGSREMWIYRGTTKVLGTLEFEDGKLTRIAIP